MGCIPLLVGTEQATGTAPPGLKEFVQELPSKVSRASYGLRRVASRTRVLGVPTTPGCPKKPHGFEPSWSVTLLGNRVSEVFSQINSGLG